MLTVTVGVTAGVPVCDIVGDCVMVLVAVGVIALVLVCVCVSVGD